MTEERKRTDWRSYNEVQTADNLVNERKANLGPQGAKYKRAWRKDGGGGEETRRQGVELRSIKVRLDQGR